VRSTFHALHNRIGASWWVGRLDDGEETLSQVEALVEAFPGFAPMVQHLRATVAARAGRWDDVIRIAESADDMSEYVEFHFRISYVEALTALGRLDEARAVLRQVELVPSREHAHFIPYLRASLELARGDPAAAVTVLDDRFAELRRDPRRLSIAVQLTSLLAVAAHRLGQHETAAVLFGYSVAEQERLGVTLRVSDRPPAERAVGECRAALGEDRFDQLATRGAFTDFAALPAVDVAASAPATP
jgi:hypothetical protein